MTHSCENLEPLDSIAGYKDVCPGDFLHNIDDLRPFRYGLDVRFNDLDGLGHVNNALYITYVEQARCRFLVAAGLWNGDVNTKAFPVILARTEIDHLAPAYWGEKLEISAWIEAVGRTSFTMGYAIASETKAVAAVRAVLVWYDYDLGKPAPLPDHCRERFLALRLEAPPLAARGR